MPQQANNKNEHQAELRALWDRVFADYIQMAASYEPITNAKQIVTNAKYLAQAAVCTRNEAISNSTANVSELEKAKTWKAIKEEIEVNK